MRVELEEELEASEEARTNLKKDLEVANQKIIEVAMESLALQNATINEVQNAQTAKDLRAKGINLYEWAPEDLAKYRAAVQIGWTEFATTPEAKALLASHIAFLKNLGAMK